MGDTGSVGPERRGTPDPAFALCGTGRHQSPINIGGVVNADLPALKPDDSSGPTEGVNNGHAIRVNRDPASTLTVDRIPFTLQQFHVHAPGENPVSERSFPMQAHIGHADAEGNLAVLAVTTGFAVVAPERDG